MTHERSEARAALRPQSLDTARYALRVSIVTGLTP